MEDKKKPEDMTGREMLDAEKDLLQRYTLEELEANPDLLYMVPEERRAEFLRKQRWLKERNEKFREEFVKHSAKIKAAMEKVREQAATWEKVRDQAIEKYGVTKDEIDVLLAEEPELAEISWGDFMRQSMTDEEDLLIGGLLDSILERSRKENRPVKEIVQDIREALEQGKTPRITIKRPDSVEYPIDKINSNVWNLLQEDTAGQLTFAAEKKGSKTQLDILYSIDFALLETTGIKITKQLQPFDKRVYIAAAALFNAGNAIITLTQIHYAMGNTKRPANNQLQKIRNSVLKMISARITVDNTSEAEKYKAYGKFVYNGVLLPVEFVEQYNVQGSLTEAAIHIFREPPLIAFSKQRGQITTVPVKLLQSPLSKTDTHLAIDDYLIERIARIKHKKDHGQGKLLYKTICDNANITTTKQRQRLPETVQRYLEHYKECNLITRYTQSADSVTVYF